MCLFFRSPRKNIHKTDDIFAFLYTLARRQIQCSLVQASIRMRWNVLNLGCTKAFGAIFRADFVEKTVARLKANRRNAIVIDILFVINPNRTENSEETVFSRSYFNFNLFAPKWSVSPANVCREDIFESFGFSVRSENGRIGAVDHIARWRFAVARVQPGCYCASSHPLLYSAQSGRITDARIRIV